MGIFSRTRDIIAAKGARVVKTIGDAFLFIADDLVTGAETATAIVETLRSEPGMLPVRASLVWGGVVSRFGDIFRGNSGKAGLLIATVDQDVVEKLWEFLEASPGVELTVDLPSRTITAGEQRFSFQIDDYTANRLLQGLDDIGSTLHHADEIAAFEAKRPAFKPTTLPMRVAD